MTIPDSAMLTGMATIGGAFWWVTKRITDAFLRQTEVSAVAVTAAANAQQVVGKAILDSNELMREHCRASSREHREIVKTLKSLNGHAKGAK